MHTEKDMRMSALGPKVAVKNVNLESGARVSNRPKVADFQNLIGGSLLWR